MKKYEFSEIVQHLITSGFVFPSSEIYGGLSNSWDYGPLGVELKQNMKKYWWKKFVQESRLNVGLDSSILMNSKVWEATGHVSNFNDPLIDCKKCHSRFRADNLISEQFPDVNVEKMTNDEMHKFMVENHVKCPVCGSSDFTGIRQFNMMFKTHIGVTEDNRSEVYLRPETAQGVFVNFKNVQRAARKKLPFGICNVGKSFRNEITPGNFVFRTREFEQMELEFFLHPNDKTDWFGYWKQYCFDFIKSLGVKEENLRYRDHEQEELAFYSRATTDIEYKFPFGWGEVWGIADRTDYDLKRHMDYSHDSLEYYDQEANQKIVPYVIEPSVGLDRLMLLALCDAYDVEQLEKDSRTVLHLSPILAPYKACIMPLSKQLGEKAGEVFQLLANKFMVAYDDTGSIGKRYRRQDAIGTPYSITVDFDTAKDNCVTVRDRDTMQQERINIDDLVAYISAKVEK